MHWISEAPWWMGVAGLFIGIFLIKFPIAWVDVEIRESYHEPGIPYVRKPAPIAIPIMFWFGLILFLLSVVFLIIHITEGIRAIGS